MRWNYEAVTGGGCDHHRYDYDYVPQAVCRFQPYEGMLRTGPTSKKTKKLKEKNVVDRRSLPEAVTGGANSFAS